MVVGYAARTWSTLWVMRTVLEYGWTNDLAVSASGLVVRFAAGFSTERSEAFRGTGNTQGWIHSTEGALQVSWAFFLNLTVVTQGAITFSRDAARGREQARTADRLRWRHPSSTRPPLSRNMQDDFLLTDRTYDLEEEVKAETASLPPPPAQPPAKQWFTAVDRNSQVYFYDAENNAQYGVPNELKEMPLWQLEGVGEHVNFSIYVNPCEPISLGRKQLGSAFKHISRSQAVLWCDSNGLLAVKSQGANPTCVLTAADAENEGCAPSRVQTRPSERAR